MDDDEISGFEQLCLLAGLNMGGILKKPVDVESVRLKLEGLARKEQMYTLKKNYQFSNMPREWLVAVCACELTNGPVSILAG